jgi:manganese/zinc/iron transport system ATP- binding protein
MYKATNALSVHNLSVFYHQFCALSDISVDIAQGLLLAIVGPNGGGKTTFIKAVLGLIKPTSGVVTFFGESLARQRMRIAYIPQRLSVDWDFPASVLDVVVMGRYGHIGWFWRPSDEDIAKSYEALNIVGLGNYAHQHINELSGGQQQRVFVARALVQEANILLLDEPLVGVDIKTEKIIIQVLQELRTQKKTIIVVHHDVQTLSEYFDWVLLLNKKKIAYGPVEQVCIPEYICAAYNGRTIFAHRKKI